ncbi:MAG: hypothetical protein K2Q34_06920 [Alphaproteobacteria bacterium]|nr:hypothetical protein [Alphaproteobacteria bacterium]
MKFFVKIIIFGLCAAFFSGSIMAMDDLVESDKKSAAVVSSHASTNPDAALNFEEKAVWIRFMNEQMETIRRQSQKIDEQIVLLDRYLRAESERAEVIKRLTEIIKGKDREIEEKRKLIESFTTGPKTWGHGTAVLEEKPVGKLRGATLAEIQMNGKIEWQTQIIEAQSQEIQRLKLALQHSYDCIASLRKPTVVTHAVTHPGFPPRHPTGGGTPRSLYYMHQ